MGHSERLRLCDVRAAFRLIGEVAELGPDPFAWRERLFEGLRRLTGTTCAIGGESEGAFFLDREVRPLAYFFAGVNADDLRPFHRYMAEKAYETIDWPARRFFTGLLAGRSLCTESHERLIAPRTWQRSELLNEYFRPMRLDDRIFSFCQVESETNLTPSLWNGMTFFRAPGDRPFGPRERRLVHLVHRELKPLMGKRLATVRDGHIRPLSPRLRQTLDLLLLGQSEKQIASRWDLAQSTVHEYATALYRRYRVSGRAELMALFLNWRGSRRAESKTRDDAE